MPAKQFVTRTRDKPYITQSDATILMTVEDLIHIAMGPAEINRVNFKLLQSILLIMARQLRMLSTSVELRVSALELSKEEIASFGKDRKGGRRGKSKGGRGGGSGSPGSSPEKGGQGKQSAITDGRDRGRSSGRGESSGRSDDDVSGKGYDSEDGRGTSRGRDDPRGRSSTRGDDGTSGHDDERGGRKSEAGRNKSRPGSELSSDDVSGRGGRSKSRSEVGRRDLSDEDAGGGRRRKSRYDDEKGGSTRKSRADDEKYDDRGGRSKSRSDQGGREFSDDDAGGRDEKGGRRKSVYGDEKGGRKSSAGVKRGHSASATFGETDRRTSSLTISEERRDQQNVLVVDKDRRHSTVGRSSRAPARVGSIEVVTYSQFDLLRGDVEELRRKSGPIPEPTLPDNRKLRKDLAAGSATLTGTMEAMQIAARVSATEKAISRFSEMITHLAASGHLPGDISERLHEVKFKSATHIRNIGSLNADMSRTEDLHLAEGRQSGRSRSKVTISDCITRSEMERYLSELKDSMMKTLNQVMMKATSASEGAGSVAKSVADKIEIASQLNNKLSTMQSLIKDYADQLEGFDTGVNIQIKGFHEQMEQLQADLRGGLKLLEASQDNAETAAVKELNERFQGLVDDLDTAVAAQGKLLSQQRALNDDLTSLMNAVDMLREQKADSEEVLDLLRDKADMSQLAGLVTSAEFGEVRGQLDSRLQACYDKFDRQQSTWFNALTDLNEEASGKAELMQLLGMKDDASRDLNVLKSRLDYLAEVLGEPKAAVLTRQLAKDAACAVCRIPALMDTEDPSASQPMALPAFYPRGAPPAEAEVCERDWKIPEPKDEREHICHRWTGGSHTVIGKNVTRQRAPPLNLDMRPTRKYEGLGDDDKYYQLEEELKPCEECNAILEKQSEPKVPPLQLVDGAGDQGRRVTVVDVLGNDPANRRMTIASLQDSYDEGRRDTAVLGGSRRGTVVDETGLANRRRSTVAPGLDQTGRRATSVDERGLQEAVSRRPIILKVEDEQAKRSTVDEKGKEATGSRRSTIAGEPATRRVTMVDEKGMQEVARKSTIAPVKGDSEGNRKVALIEVPEGTTYT